MAAEKIDALSLDITSNLNTDNLDKIISKLNELGKTLDGLKGKSVAVNIRETGDASKTAATGVDKLTSSFASQAIKITAVIALFRKLTNVISSSVANASGYIKSLNMFTVSLGEYADNATKYGETVSNALGIDIAGWQDTQGIFTTLIKGMGITGDKAAYMSQNLTQLTYDISSFYGITTTEAANKLKSALAGRTQPTRTLGYTVDQAQAVDYAKNPANYGKQTFAINQQTGAIEANTKATDDNTQHKIVNFNQLLSSEKAIIRYNLLMTQNTQVQGNFARTLNDPYNQLKIFKEQVNQTSRAFGNMFIPALNKVLPYLSAFTQLATEAFQAVARLFGFELPDMKDRTSIDTKPYDDVVKATGQGAKNAKKMKDYMLGIDELNVFNPNTGAGAGSGSAGGQNSNLKNMKLQGYDFLSKAIKSSIEGAKKTLKQLANEFKMHPITFPLKIVYEGAGELGSKLWELILGKTPEQLAKDAREHGLTLGGEFMYSFGLKLGELSLPIWNKVFGDPTTLNKIAQKSGNSIGSMLGKSLLLGIYKMFKGNKLFEFLVQKFTGSSVDDIIGKLEEELRSANSEIKNVAKFNSSSFNVTQGTDIGKHVSQSVGSGIEKGAPYVKSSAKTIPEAARSGMIPANGMVDFNNVGTSYTKETAKGITTGDAKQSVKQATNTIGTYTGNSYAGSLGSSANKTKAYNASYSVASSGYNGANAWVAEYKKVGENSTKGYIDGVLSMLKETGLAGAAIGATALKALEKKVKTGSPAKEFIKIGKFSGQGFANGMTESLPLIANSAKKMGASALSALTSASDISNRIITGNIADPMSRGAVSLPASSNVGYGIAGANGEAMANLASSVYQAVVSGMATANLNGDRETNIIIDGKQVFKAVETEKRKRGVAVGNGTFSR